MGSVPYLTSHKVDLWFHVEIVCRYGFLVVVQTDKGSEYKGEFDMYMHRNGVEHQFIATMNPCANGLVEHMKRVIKSALQRFETKYPEGKWWEI